MTFTNSSLPKRLASTSEQPEFPEREAEAPVFASGMGEIDSHRGHGGHKGF